MPILNIKTYPDDLLRKECKEVSVVNGEMRRLLDDMVMTMHAAKGVGLAAPQVGLDVCLIVVDIGKGPMRLANPKIVKSSGSSTLEEGCLSLPDLNVEVKRPSSVTISAMNIQGGPELIEATGLLSHVLQHEIDHLYGKLLIDYLPFYKRPFIRRRLRTHKKVQ